MLKDAGVPLNCTFSEPDWHLLASFWHPVAFSAEIRQKPVPATLLDVDLVLWRTRAGVSVAADYCPHRGTRMSLGAVRGDQIVCRYHGLHFDGAGMCTRIPGSGPDAKIPRSLKLSSYSAVEKYGVVWVCLKPEARTPLPAWPTLEDEGLQRCNMSALWNTAAGRHTENFCDTAHFSFTHTGTFGWVDRPSVQPYEVAERDYGLSYRIDAPQQNGSLVLDNPMYADVPSDYDVTFPFSTMLVLHFERGVEHIFDIVSPMSSRKSRIFMIKTRDHDMDHPVDEWLAFQANVNEEDRLIVEAQIPQQLPIDLRQEFHLPSDRISVAYRRKWRELGLQGDIS